MRSNWKRLKDAVVTNRLRSVWGGASKSRKRGTGQQHMSVSLARNQGLSLYQVYTNYRKRTPAGVPTSQRRFFASPSPKGPTPAGLGAGAREDGGGGGGDGSVVMTAQQHATSHLESEQRLRMKVSIGTGLVLGMHTGGVGGRWEYFIAGDPMTQILEAEKVAEPGYVVLHEKVRCCRAACRVTGRWTHYPCARTPPPFACLGCHRRPGGCCSPRSGTRAWSPATCRGATTSVCCSCPSRCCASRASGAPASTPQHGLCGSTCGAARGGAGNRHRGTGSLAHGTSPTCAPSRCPALPAGTSWASGRCACTTWTSWRSSRAWRHCSAATCSARCWTASTRCRRSGWARCAS